PSAHCGVSAVRWTNSGLDLRLRRRDLPLRAVLLERVLDLANAAGAIRAAAGDARLSLLLRPFDGPDVDANGFGTCRGNDDVGTIRTAARALPIRHGGRITRTNRREERSAIARRAARTHTNGFAGRERCLLELVKDDHGEGFVV